MCIWSENGCRRLSRVQRRLEVKELKTMLLEPCAARRGFSTPPQVVFRLLLQSLWDPNHELHAKQSDQLNAASPRKFKDSFEAVHI